MKRFISTMLIISLTAALFCGCGEAEQSDWRDNPQNVIDDKYGTFYEIFLYSYCDSDGDGIGDINGLISKLDYLNDGNPETTDDLGVDGIWLMPVMQSPSYHKYDTVDYMTIDTEYGTNEDFENLLTECHNRGIRVIIDLAMNHSSSEHPWFKEACQYIASLDEDEEPDSSVCKYVDYYNFSKDQESGYSVVDGTDWYYESQFSYTMPDLNLLNEDVQQEFEDIADYWLGLGVDGFRLDAVKYFEYGNNDECIDTLGWFNDYVKGVNENAYIVCECWDDQAVYAKYYASGVDSMFDFNFADKSGYISKTVNGTMSANGLVNKMVEEQELYSSYSDTYINAPFYTNHDMGRSAGYYAGDNSMAQTKMAQAINLFMTGNAFIYYGEELGMKGTGKDENKRAPMQWSDDENAQGMCDGPADMEDFEMKYGSLEEQQEDAGSIYNFVKDVILLKNQNPEIARGSVENLTDISDDTIAAIKKTYNDQSVYIIYNISAEEEAVDISSINAEVSLAGTLTTDDGQIVLDGDSIDMPPYSVAVLR